MTSKARGMHRPEWGILQVSALDLGGGAERAALDLHRAYLRRGLDARLVVGFRRAAPEPGVSEIDPYEGLSPPLSKVAALDRALGSRRHFPGRDTLRHALAMIAWPPRLWHRWRGLDDFSYPGTSLMVERLRSRGWVLHLHNVHGSYFDLRALPQLSRALPVVWTLHDNWAFTGHCAYFMNCGRWEHGCGACPDLKRPPSIQKDQTAANWLLKQRIYKQTDLHLVCPSRWMQRQVERSILRDAPCTVIPNGVDLAVFHLGARREARQALGLSESARICLYVGSSGLGWTPYKDPATVRESVARIRSRSDVGPVQFISVGGGATVGNSGSRDWSVGHVARERLALFYQAADVFIHAARADNFPYTVLEAMASGVPVVATSVGGVPEQVRSGETGYLVPEGDSSAMAERVAQLLQDSSLRGAMGREGAAVASREFALDRAVDRYVALYASVRSPLRAGKGYAGD